MSSNPIRSIVGEAEVTISGSVIILKEGEMVVMPANHPHALKASKKVQDALGNDKILTGKRGEQIDRLRFGNNYENL